jgi:hypothetical protein
VTRLHQMMLDELQRRNYSPNTARSSSTPLKTSPGTLVDRHTGLVRSTSGSIRRIFSGTGSCRRERLRVRTAVLRFL